MITNLPITGSTQAIASYSTNNSACITITNVAYDSDTNELVASYEVSLLNPSLSGRYSVSGLAGYVGGIEAYIQVANPGGWVWDYSTWHNGDVKGSGTVRIAANKGTTQSIVFAVKAMFDWGYSDARWEDPSYYVYASDACSVAVPADPTITINESSKVSASRGGSNGSAVLSATNLSAGNYSISCNGQSSQNAGLSLTGLSNNTSYQYTATITNSYGLSTTVTGNLYLDSVNPSVSSSVTNITPFEAEIDYTVAYDTNRKLDSFVINYGTTQSYGQTSQTGMLSGLTQNTQYYYEIVGTDQNDGGPETTVHRSFSTTGTFTTLIDQADIFTKINGTWKVGKLFINIGGTWKKAQKVFIKNNGTWMGGA